MKCEKCGFESAHMELFQSIDRVFNSKPLTVCLDCFSKKDKDAYKTLLFVYLIVGSIGLFLIFAFPSTIAGALLLNAEAILFFTLLCTIGHETGHFLAGRLTGHRVFRIEIGSGQVVFESISDKLRWTFCRFPFGGRVYGCLPSAEFYRVRSSIFTIGGPLANIVFLIAGAKMLAWDNYFQSEPFSGFIPVKMLLLTNGVMLAVSIWPREFDTNRGKIANDSLLLWRTWFKKNVAVGEMPTYFYFYEASECVYRQRYGDAQKWVEKGLERFPGNFNLEYLRASIFSNKSLHLEACRSYSILLGKWTKDPELRALFLNNLAWSFLLSGVPDLLRKAEHCSALAIQLKPAQVYYEGTRGSVLVELGKYEEGVKLLQAALKKHTDRSAQAFNLCFWGLAEIRQGNSRGAADYFRLARKFNPDCEMLKREPVSMCCSTKT